LRKKAVGRFVIISVAWAIADNVANPVAQKRRAAWAQVAKAASPEFANAPPPRKNSVGSRKNHAREQRANR